MISYEETVPILQDLIGAALETAGAEGRARAGSPSRPLLALDALPSAFENIPSEMDESWGGDESRMDGAEEGEGGEGEGQGPWSSFLVRGGEDGEENKERWMDPSSRPQGDGGHQTHSLIRKSRRGSGSGNAATPLGNSIRTLLASLPQDSAVPLQLRLALWGGRVSLSSSLGSGAEAEKRRDKSWGPLQSAVYVLMKKYAERILQSGGDDQSGDQVLALAFLTPLPQEEALSIFNDSIPIAGTDYKALAKVSALASEEEDKNCNRFFPPTQVAKLGVAAAVCWKAPKLVRDCLRLHRNAR